MIDKILERLEEVRMKYFLTIANGGSAMLDFAYEQVGEAIDQCKEIVQEVAKEYDNGWIPVETELPKEHLWAGHVKSEEVFVTFLDSDGNARTDTMTKCKVMCA